MSAHAPHPVIAVLALLLGATLWGVFWYPLRVLEANDLSGLWATLLIYGSALAVGMIVLAWRRGTVRCHPGWLLVLTFASGWTNVSFILAVLEGPVMRVTLLFYLSPLWTVLLGRLLLGERLSRGAQVTMLLAMCGAVIMLWDRDSGWPWPQSRADWLAISAGCAFALSNVMVRKLHEEDIWVKTVFAWLGVVVLAAAGIVLGKAPWPDVASSVVSLTIACGGLFMVIMTLLVLFGLTHMPAHRAAVILLFELIAAALSAQWLTDEVVLPNEWLGGVLIVSAAYFVARHQMSDHS